TIQFCSWARSSARGRDNLRAYAAFRSLVFGCRPVSRAAQPVICASIFRANLPGIRPAGKLPISVPCCGSRSRAAVYPSPPPIPPRLFPPPSPDPAHSPLIEFNFLDDERDLRRLLVGFRWVVDFLLSDAIRPLCGRPFPVRFTDPLRRLNRLTRPNAVKSALIAALLNVEERMSDYMLASLTGGGAPLGQPVAQEGPLEDPP